MKQIWEQTELEKHWKLQSNEMESMSQLRTPKNKMGYAVLLKWFQLMSRFPTQRRDIPNVVVEYMAKQLNSHPKDLDDYAWKGRTIERHRASIRNYLGYREITSKETSDLKEWL